MDSPVSAHSYLARAKALLKSNDKASLFYAALELRCGVEARLQEHIAVAPNISNTQKREWEIKKLGRTLDQSFGLGDSFLLVFLNLEDGRQCQFIYAPVSARLQDIAKRCGDYLHALPTNRIDSDGFWEEFRSLISEGCGLLNISCSSEILRPSIDHGLHFTLNHDDPRVSLIEAFRSGAAGSFQTAKITPAGPLTYYPADDA
jgi:hypothetical protein